MKTTSNKYHGHRFPAGVISHGVWLHHRFAMSLRDVEDLLAKRGILVTHERIRQWCRKFGPEYARRLKRREGRLGDVWHLDEVFVKIGGERQYLWRAVDQAGDVIVALLHGPEKWTYPPSPEPGSLHSVAIRHPQKGHRIEDFARQLYLDSLALHGSTSQSSTDDGLVSVHGILDNGQLRKRQSCRMRRPQKPKKWGHDLTP